MDPFQKDDEVEQLKAWWKNYGNALILGVALGASLLAGYSYWRHYQTRQAEAASELYTRMLDSFQQKNTAAAADTGKKILDDYAGTVYAGKAALILARIRFDAADPAGARQHLEWALREAAEETTRQVARLRLARLLFEQGDLGEALRLLEAKSMNGFESEHEELRGDLLAVEGRKDAARTAYQAAIAHLPKGSPYASILQMKFDDLGPEGSS